MSAASLRAHRRTLTAAWERFHAGRAPDGVRAEVAASWHRSARDLSAPVAQAPVDPEEQVREAWQASELRAALEPVADDIARTAVDCDLVAALTDDDGRILWSSGGRHMQDRAASVNFVPGGRWDEASVGTNALDLALRTGQPAQVFSAEHFSPAVHGWVCYAAPLVAGPNGPVVGVLDLSTTWDRSHPMALAAVAAFARTINQVLAARPARGPRAPRADGLGSTGPATRSAQSPRLEVLGRPRLWLEGTPVMLTLRQAELLLALAAHPDGLTLDQLAAHVYGDLPVAPTTVKVEVSRLRRVVPGLVGSRPYRLEGPLAVDALDVLELVSRGDVRAAAQAARAEVLPASEAPIARSLGVRVEVGVRSLVLAGRDPVAASTLAGHRPDDVALIEHALALHGEGTPQRAELEARLAAALVD